MSINLKLVNLGETPLLVEVNSKWVEGAQIDPIVLEAAKGVTLAYQSTDVVTVREQPPQQAAPPQPQQED